MVFDEILMEEISETVDAEDVESFSKASVGKRNLVRLSLLLIAVVIVTLAHEGYMLVAQVRIMQATDQAFFPAIPCYLIPTVVPLLIGGALCVHVATRKYCCMRTDVDFVKFLYITAFLFGIMHTFQVAVYLFVDTVLFINVVPKNTSCECKLFDAALSDIVESCSCYVPEMRKLVVLTRTSIPLEDDLQTLVKMHVREDSEMEKLNQHLKLMVTLLQSSILIAFLRFPLWLVFNSVQLKHDLMKRLKKQAKCEKFARQQSSMHLSMLFEDLDEDSCKEIARSASVQRSNSEPFNDVVAVVMRNLRLERGFEQERWLIQTQSSQEKWHSRVYAIELCYFCFVEIVDAFSLLDNLSENATAFAASPALTYTTLFFISLSLFVGTAANFLSSHPFRSLPINRYGKSAVVVSNNIPLFILRCVILSRADGTQDSLFFLFALKEFLILILAFIEIIVVFKSPKETAAEKS